MEKYDKTERKGEEASGLFGLLIKNDKVLHVKHMHITGDSDWLTLQAANGAESG